MFMRRKENFSFIYRVIQLILTPIKQTINPLKLSYLLNQEKYTNIELFGKEMEKLKELTEAEYKGEFFAYVDKRIRMVEDRRKVENENTVTL